MSKLPDDVAECHVCHTQFRHPAPGTGGTWTCSYACRMGHAPTLPPPAEAGTAGEGMVRERAHVLLGGRASIGTCVVAHDQAWSGICNAVTAELARADGELAETRRPPG